MQSFEFDCPKRVIDLRFYSVNEYTAEWFNEPHEIEEQGINEERIETLFQCRDADTHEAPLESTNLLLKKPARVSSSVLPAPPILAQAPPKKTIMVVSKGVEPATCKGVKRKVSDAASFEAKLVNWRESKNAATSSSSSSASSIVHMKKGNNKGTTKKNETVQDNDLSVMLKMHNQKFKSPALYEPSRHSVRDIRKWEKATGKCWANLSSEEREGANSAIAREKQFCINVKENIQRN